jgi:putative peptidoglycan lipid II flippase
MSSAAAAEHSGNSTAVAAWTMVSRVTGFVRVAVIAAVLGPTYLGSLFLAINALPQLALQFLAGSLIGSLLIPALTPTIDRGDRAATDAIAGGFLGSALAAFSVVAVLLIAAAPLLLGVLTIGVGDRGVASDQLRAGWLLIALTMPQLPLYATALIGGAVMNAHGRFRLAAAAPVAENAGVIATMLVVAVVYGSGPDIGSVSDAELLLLGLGSTGAVVLHAATMLWGARRSGPSMAPRRGRHVPAVRELLGQLRSSVGQTSLGALRFFLLLTVANTVRGGVVAFQLALNFLYLPVQVGAQPVTLTMLPMLSRLHQSGDTQRFRDEVTRGLTLVCFVTVPSAVAYFVLAGPLADALSIGAMAGSAGPALVAACVAGIALAVVGESAFLLFTYASYARGDARSPFVATAAGTGITLVCLPVALALDDSDALLAIGLALSAGALFSAWFLRARVDARLPPPLQPATRLLSRTLIASAAMAVPVYGVSAAITSAVGGAAGAAAAVLAAAGTGIAVFVAVQQRWHSPELAFFSGGLRRLRRRSA